MAVTVATPDLIYVGWDCRRCGHTGGWAHTTIPFDQAQLDAMRVLIDTCLRTRLVEIHQQRQGCVALPSDFVIYPLTPHGDRAA